jgi:hypothetical protein
MATFLATLNFIITYFWITSKYQIFSILFTCIAYFLNFEDNIKLTISLSCFAMNLILIYTIFTKDNYLTLNGFYRVFNIFKLDILISKSLVIFILISSHVSLLMLITFKLSIQVCLLVNIVILLVLNICILALKMLHKLYLIIFTIALISLCLFLRSDASTSIISIIVGVSLFTFFRMYISQKSIMT